MYQKKKPPKQKVEIAIHYGKGNEFKYPKGHSKYKPKSKVRPAKKKILFI